MTFIELLVVMMVMSVAVTMLASMIMHTSRQRTINRENAIAANAARTKVELMRNEEFRDLFALFNGDAEDDPAGAGTAPGRAFAVPGLTLLADDEDGLVGEIFMPTRIVTEKVTATWGVTTLDTTLVQLGDIVGGLLGGLGGLGGGTGGSGGGGLLGGGLLGGGLLGGGGGGGLLGGGSGSGSTTFYTLREDYVDARLGMPRDLNGDSLIDDLDHSPDYVVLPVHVQVRWRGKFGPRQYDLFTQIALFTKVEG